MHLDTKIVAGFVLPPGKTDVIIFDATLSGFGYRVRAGAHGKVMRSWVVQYRHAGRSRRVLIGSADVLSAEQARAAAKKLLARVTLGEDPQSERSDRRGRDRLTFRAVAAEHLAAKKHHVRARPYVELERYLTGDYFKPFHSMAIDRIGRRELAARLVTIARESGPPTAVKARSTIADMFVWAMRSGLIETNPTINTPAPASGHGRERVLSDDELAYIWRACGDDDHGRIVKLLILTGCRRQEIGGMGFSEIDFERGTWTLPPARSKTHRPHTLPLLAMMRAIIEPVPHRAARDQLFGDRSRGGFNGWCRGKTGLDQRSGVQNWTLHDIRRTVATRLGDLGVQPHIIETILNHQSGHRRGPAGIYNRSQYENEVRAALALWGDHVRVLATSGERKVLSYAQKAS
jgi:integrase